MNRRPFSVLPLAAVLVAAPFFADYREQPLRFGLLQGLLVLFISIAGGFKIWREKMQNLALASFWILLILLSVAAPFLARALWYG
jgi:hypothetical protein